MCGIVALHGLSDPVLGRRMLDRIVHRGPDDEGHLALAGGWLGHRRLSIVDVAGGHQPLHQDGLALVANGEVYNHAELRADLAHRRFTTDSDNEVALHLVDEHGPAALARLHGMYALAVAGDDGRFVAARDPVGIKPLYWAERDGVHIFASELVAFDADWLPHAEAFPPGHYWTPEEGLKRLRGVTPTRVRVREAAGDDPPPDVFAEVRDSVTRAVTRRMMADVGVGVFLSGGLDSSLIAAVAAEQARRDGRPLKSFAVGTETSSDLAAAREVAEFLGTEHHECVYTAEQAAAVLPAVVRSIESFDPMLVRSAVPNYLLSELAARHVKVVLTGEGADELFAGYSYLADVPGAAAGLQKELVRIVEGLHNLNLQRADRVSMAHGLEARVPFLDVDVIRFALSLPPAWKLTRDDRPEKWLLRRAFDGWLPQHILWRGKEQFGTGSGLKDALLAQVTATISEEDFARERGAVDPPLRTREEVAYFRHFRDHLGGVDPQETIGRFATA